MNLRFWLLGLVCVFAINFSLHAEDQLFKYKGKTYSSKDLEVKHQFRLFDIEMEAHKGKKELIEAAFLDIYFREIAKKEKKTVEEIRKKQLNLEKPSEAELKKFYEENKKRIPYPFDKVRGEIEKFVKRNKAHEKQHALIESLEKKGTFKTMQTKPRAPKVSIDTAGYHRRGLEKSKVTVVEFADYKCPHCREAAMAFKKIYPKFEDKVNFVFIDFPISSDLSFKAAEAAYCAGKQGKYWEFHNLAFEKQASIEASSFEKFAKELSLDKTKFSKCQKDPATVSFVKKSKLAGESFGVSGTPTVFINGKKHTGGFKFELLHKAITAALKGKKAS